MRTVQMNSTCVYYTSNRLALSSIHCWLNNLKVLANSCMRWQERLAWGGLHPSAPPLMLNLQLLLLGEYINSPITKIRKILALILITS